MTIIAGVSLLLGAALGVSSRILVLLSIVILGAFCTLIMGVAHGAGVWSVAITILNFALALQLGYLLGVALLMFPRAH